MLVYPCGPYLLYVLTFIFTKLTKPSLSLTAFTNDFD